MDWVKQVQVIHSSYCGANLLCCLSVKDISVGFWFGVGFFLYISFVCLHLFVVMMLSALREGKL